MIARVALILAALGISLLPLGAQAADKLTVRAGQHDGFGRIVIDPPRRLSYDAEVDGGRLTIRFEDAVDADVSRIARVIGKHVRSARVEDGNRIVADLMGPHTARDFINEGSIVIDLRPAGSGGARELSVNTRFGSHPTYTRMVFDWPGRVQYRLREGGDGAVSVRFDRAAQVNIDAGAIRRARGFESAGARIEDGATLVDLKVGGRVRHFRDGFKVVVDVFDAGPRDKPAPKRETAKVAPKAPDVPAPAPAAKPEPKQVADATPEPAARAVKSGAPVSLAAPLEDMSATAQPAVAAPVEADGSFTAEGPVNLLPPVLEPALANPDALPSGVADLDVEIISEIDGALLRFPFIEKTGAAIFRRGGSLWIVFDKLARIDTAAIQAAAGAFVRDIEQVPHESAIVLRLTTIPGYNALSVRENNRWEVVLAPQLLKPEDALGVTTSVGSVPTVTIGPTLPAPPLRVVDPEVGDEIRVIPVYASGDGVAQRFLYPDFRLLASIQGVAMIPLSDRIEVRSSEDRVIVSASGGLRLTDASARNRVLASGGADELERMYRFVEWRHAELGDYDPAHRELLAQLETMQPEMQNVGRIELARFYLSHGLADRALGLLEVVAARQPEIERVPSFKALRGASRFLMGNTDGAERDLFDRELDAEPEIDLWRAAVRGAQGEVVASSFELQTAERFVQDYPDALRIHFAFLGAEIAMSAGDPVAAEFWLEVIGDAELTPSERDRRRVFTADIAARNGEIDTAISLYDRTINGRDRLSRALATMAKTDLLLIEEDITPSEAVDELDRLRYVWRGDGLEFKILRRLGELEIAAGRYRDGLRTLKRAASNFPEHPAAPLMADDMRMVFERLYLDGEADEMEPISAIALFNEFRELAPAGDAGDAMIRRLADRLVAVDLLAQAAELLDHQVNFRLEGNEKAGVGARLAMVHLLDRKPQQALDALNASVATGLEPGVERERAIARARAQTMLGAFDPALAALVGYDGEEIDVLRAEIFWKAQRWRNAANVFAELAGPVPGADAEIDEQRSRYILNSAVALALGGETNRLSNLGVAFGPAMDKTPYAADFRAITSVDTAPRDFAEVLQRVAAVDEFEAFMDSYRARLSGAETEAPAKS